MHYETVLRYVKFHESANWNEFLTTKEEHVQRGEEC